MKNSLFTVFVLTGLLSACAMPPTQQDTARLPIVTFGDSVPKDQDYILYFPAGKPIPTEVAISGNLFKQQAKDTLTVSLDKGIYSYREWVSFDQKIWRHNQDVFKLEVDIKVPGYKRPSPGHVRISLDEKKGP